MATLASDEVTKSIGSVAKLIHERFGHLGLAHQKILTKLNYLPFCKECATSKATRKKQNRGNRQTPDDPFHTVHVDIAGPFVESDTGYKYAISFTCGKTQYTHVYFLRAKSEALGALMNYVSDTWIKLKMPIHKIMLDNAGEFGGGLSGEGEEIQPEFKLFCKSVGIELNYSDPGNQAQNGKAERKWRTIKDGTRVYLAHSKRPVKDWTHAMKAYTYTLNRMPCRTNPMWKSPFEMLHEKKPELKHLRKWGMPCVVTQLSGVDKTNWGPKGREGFFMGYAASHANGSYVVYMPDTKRYVVSRNIKIDEGHCDAVIKSAQMTIGRLEKFEAQAGELSDAADQSDAAQTDELNPQAGTADEITEAGKLFSEGAKAGKKPKTSFTSTTKIGKIKLTDDDIIIWTKKIAKSPYITGRCKDMDGLTVKEALNRMYKDAAGIAVKYKRSDLKYDISGGRIRLESAIEAHTVELQEIESDSVKMTTRELLEHNGEVALTISLPTGTLDVLVEKKAEYTRNSKEPKNLDEALEMPDATQWKNAVIKELTSLKDMGTYRIVSLPPGRKAVGCKLVLTRKFKSTGEIEKWKARCVLLGYRQREGVDYKETFAPTGGFSSFRIMCSLACHYDWKLRQIDFQTAYLNSEMDHEMYMKLPPGIQWLEDMGSLPGNPVMHLLKGLYGAKQAGRLWNKMLDASLKRRGFKVTTHDPCMYIKFMPGGRRLMVLGYVDDCAITGDSDVEIEELISSIKEEYNNKIDDLGELEWFLGMRIQRDRKKRVLSIDHSRYITDALEKYGYSDVKPSTLPFPVQHDLKRRQVGDLDTKEKKGEEFPYLSMLGAALWCTRVCPEIQYAVSLLAMFSAAPEPSHCKALKNVFQYLKSVKEMGLVFHSNPDENLKFEMRGFVDASYADNYGNNLDNRRSTTGFVFMLGGAAISWSSKRQAVVACSTTESEYIAAYTATREAICLRRMLIELGETSVIAPVDLNEDNQACIKLAKNPCSAQRTKSMDTKYHFLRQAVQEGKINLKYVDTKEQLADIFTKMLPFPQFRKLRTEIGRRHYQFE